MYNYKSILLLLFFLFPFVSYAQENQPGFEVSIGGALKKSDRKSLRTVVGQDDGGFIVLQKKMKRSFGFLRQEPYHLYLQYFNEDLQEVKEEKLRVKKGGERLSFQFLVQLKDSLFLFASATDEASGKELLFARPINKLELKPEGEWKKIAEVDNRKKDGFFSWSRSKDKSKLLLLYSHLSEKLERQNFNLYVLNQELERLWHKENCLPFPLRRFSTVQYHLDNSGNVYLLNTLFRNGDKSRTSYQYHLLAYKNSGSELHRYGIELPGKFLTEIKITTDHQQNLIGGGFYADKGSTDVKGAYFFRINGLTNEVTSKSNMAFAADFVPQTFESQSLSELGLPQVVPFDGAHQLKRSDFELHELVLRKDGSILLLGEQYSLTTTTRVNQRQSGAKSETNYFYNYKDVLLVSMSKKGEIEWAQKIGKRQYSQDDSGLYASYMAGEFQDEICLLFNNYSFLAEREGGKGLKPVNRSETVLVKVDRNGRLRKEPVPELNRLKLSVIPRSGIETGGGSFMLLAGDKENHHFIRLNLKSKNVLSLR
ncbi:hypothetical protein [Nafulsella turpanensis]|uniref:hypothetical protein n=1 Tax=Nafulsella turpanensis TaxID=1265690 RepID=UPI00034B71F8|nr:hypothetical protein [Nafulsella turpanensis]